MELTKDAIVKLIKTPFNKEIVSLCRSYEKIAKEYIDGIGYKNPITDDLINSWENHAKIDLKKHLSECPTLPIIKLIKDELNRGINTEKAISSKEIEDYNNTFSAIWKNSNMDYFIDTFLKKAIDTDFNSFILITKGKKVEENGDVYEERDGVKRLNDGTFYPYVIYISINDVIDFKDGGDKLEYLIYRYSINKDGIIYRVIDSKNDWLIYEKNNDYIELSKIPHGLTYCPAKQISDLYMFSSNTPELKSCQLYHIMGDLISYVIQYKEFKTSEVCHANPKYWSYGVKCPICDGRKAILNPDPNPDMDSLYMFHNSSRKIGESIQCPYCKGEGSIATLNSKQVLKLPAKIGDTSFNFSGDPAGFIQFPKDSLEYQAEQLKDLEYRIIYNSTGNKNIISSRMQTATEVDTNTRSLQDRINYRQKMIESNVMFVGNTILKLLRVNIEFYYKFQRNISYKDDAILYKEIEMAMAANMPEEYINEIKKELTKNRFSNEEIVNSINEKLTNEYKEEQQPESVQDVEE